MFSSTKSPPRLAQTVCPLGRGHTWPAWSLYGRSVLVSVLVSVRQVCTVPYLTARYSTDGTVRYLTLRHGTVRYLTVYLTVPLDIPYGIPYGTLYTVHLPYRPLYCRTLSLYTCRTLSLYTAVHCILYLPYTNTAPAVHQYCTCRTPTDLPYTPYSLLYSLRTPSDVHPPYVKWPPTPYNPPYVID